jgi:hypothetical protein
MLHRFSCSQSSAQNILLYRRQLIECFLIGDRKIFEALLFMLLRESTKMGFWSGFRPKAH